MILDGAMPDSVADILTKTGWLIRDSLKMAARHANPQTTRPKEAMLSG